MRDHGGDLDTAIARYGGAASTWIDLSTGINPRPYPLPPIPAGAWAALPTGADTAALETAARATYGTTADCIACAGAQAAIQMIPNLRSEGNARVLSPTYNEHAAALQSAGWSVAGCESLDALSGADVAVVVNPNNPDGRRFAPDDLMQLSETVGLLVVDESFADTEPKLSVSPRLAEDTGSIVVMRSFGKFFGLAGLRLGFVLTGSELASQLRSLTGPWPVSGPAIVIGRQALVDAQWRANTIARLRSDAERLDRLARVAGWTLVGGTPLFRTYETSNAERAKDQLAQARIWSRSFPYSDRWLRLGLPGEPEHWSRLEAGLGSVEIHLELMMAVPA